MGQGTDDDPRKGPQPLRWLRNVHQRVAGEFAAALSALLRSRADVTLVGVERRTYGEFLDHLGESTCFHVLRAAVLEERLLLDIEPPILLAMIDRLLGAADEEQPPSGEVGSSLTAIEQPPDGPDRRPVPR